MAQKLVFSGIQPVEFNGRDCTPRTPLTTGERLRLAKISWDSDANSAAADELLANCFIEKDQAFVLDFISTKMTPTDKGILRNYLLEGEKALAILDATSDKMAEKAVNKMTDEAVAGIVQNIKEGVNE